MGGEDAVVRVCCAVGVSAELVGLGHRHAAALADGSVCKVFHMKFLLVFELSQGYHGKPDNCMSYFVACGDILNRVFDIESKGRRVEHLRVFAIA